MNLKVKTLVAAVAMVVAGAAQATPISIDGYTDPGLVGTGNGSGNIFLSVLDPVANLSVIWNTGLTVGQFRNNNASLINTFTVADAGVQSFFSTNAANLSQMRWNLGGLSNGPDIGANAGALTTNGNYAPNSPDLTGPLDGGALQTTMNLMANYAALNAFALNSANSVVSNSLSGSGYIGSNSWGDTIGGQLLWSNSQTGFGGTQTTSFFSFDAVDPAFNPSTRSAFANGQWKVDTTLGQLSYVSAVPVPAAVWLLGSGLVGLVGISRRRTKV